MGSLQAHEQRLQRTAENTMEQAFQSKVDLNKCSEDLGRGHSGIGRGRENASR